MQMHPNLLQTETVADRRRNVRHPGHDERGQPRQSGAALQSIRSYESRQSITFTRIFLNHTSSP